MAKLIDTVEKVFDYLTSDLQAPIAEHSFDVDERVVIDNEDIFLIRRDVKFSYYLKRQKRTEKDGQLFPRGTIVWISEDERLFDGSDGEGYMGHFEHGCLAIVEFSYAERFGGDDFKSYSLQILDVKMRPEGSAAWYKEKQLSLAIADTKVGLDILEKYVIAE